MSVIDVGCGQGGFTVSVAKIVGENGKVLSVDISDEYLKDLMGNLNKWCLKNRVTFVQADAADLEGVVSDEVADTVVSYRFLEELKHPADLFKIAKEMVRIVKKGGKVCFIELSTETRNEAEENYIRLHAESGDSFFDPHACMLGVHSGWANTSASGCVSLSFRMASLLKSIWTGQKPSLGMVLHVSWCSL